MESLHRWHPVPASAAERAAADEERARELARTELRAAIALAGHDRRYRILVCGTAADARLVASLDDVAARAGIVLERRIREGGRLDVVVHGRGDRAPG